MLLGTYFFIAQQTAKLLFNIDFSKMNIQIIVLVFSFHFLKKTFTIEIASSGSMLR